MDNPDFLYHVADIDPAGAYRIRGNLGEAAYTSMTVYSASGLADATATSRLDSDAIETDQNGNFEVVISSEQVATTNWLAMPADANSIWIRGFHEDVYRERPGEFVIEPLNEVKPPRWIEPEKLAYRLERLGKGMVGAVKGMLRGAAYDLEHPNEIRVWHEMQGGAVFTEPNIYYQRGSWQLEDDEVLVIEGVVPDCRYWNLMLYSRFLNSLDHRHRNISLTGSRAEVGEDGSFRMVLSSEDPELRNWVDTEGRPFGMFVFRWLQPTEEPALPKVRVVKKERLGELS